MGVPEHGELKPLTPTRYGILPRDKRTEMAMFCSEEIHLGAKMSWFHRTHQKEIMTKELCPMRRFGEVCPIPNGPVKRDSMPF